MRNLRRVCSFLFAKSVRTVSIRVRHHFPFHIPFPWCHLYAVGVAVGVAAEAVHQTAVRVRTYSLAAMVESSGGYAIAAKHDKHELSKQIANPLTHNPLPDKVWCKYVLHVSTLTIVAPTVV